MLGSRDDPLQVLHKRLVRKIVGDPKGFEGALAGRERLQQTILEECWRPAFARSLVPKLTALQRDLNRYLNYYDFDRAYTGRLTQGRVPGEIVYGARKVRPAR